MKPVHTIRLGNVSASVWQRTGKRGTFHEVTVQRSYKGKDGKPAYTGSFNARDLDTLKAALDLASAYLQSPKEPAADGPGTAADPLAEFVNGHAPEVSSTVQSVPETP